MHGARIADSTPPAPAPAAKAAAAPAPPAPSPAADKVTEDELRARVLKKYTSGLR